MKPGLTATVTRMSLLATTHPVKVARIPLHTRVYLSPESLNTGEPVLSSQP